MSKPLIELFVKASAINRSDVGSCLISQKWMMAFYLLVEVNEINLKVTPVNPDCPEKIFTELSTGKRLPAAKVLSGFKNINSKAYLLSDNLEFCGDELEEFIKMYHRSRFEENVDKIREAELHFENLINKFNLYLTFNNDSSMLGELCRLNDYIGAKKTTFLISEKMSLVDCDLMPKLHHIRVVCNYIRGKDIPKEMTHLWSYLRQMYLVDAFKISCSNDSDILLHYSDKVKFTRDQLRNINLAVKGKLDATSNVSVI